MQHFIEDWLVAQWASKLSLKYPLIYSSFFFTSSNYVGHPWESCPIKRLSLIGVMQLQCHFGVYYALNEPIIHFILQPCRQLHLTYTHLTLSSLIVAPQTTYHMCSTTTVCNSLSSLPLFFLSFAACSSASVYLCIFGRPRQCKGHWSWPLGVWQCVCVCASVRLQ